MFDMLATLSFVIVFVLVIALIAIIGYYNDIINIDKNNYERLYNSWSEVIEEIKTVEARENQALDDLKYINNMNLSLESTVEELQKENDELKLKFNNKIKLEKYSDSEIELIIAKIIEIENRAQSSIKFLQQYKNDIIMLRSKIHIAFKGVK